MSCKIDDRLPKEVGTKSLPLHPAVKTPWEKLISFHDAYHYACRHHAVIGAVYQEVLRILVPDYDERCTLMCKTDVGVKNYVFGKMEVAPGYPYREYHLAKHYMHPFFKGTDNTGGFRAAVFGDNGDERLLMQGRVNDFGTYRAEKELDACPWDIMGSEICRTSTASLEEIGRCCGDNCEYNMVEARGCGDLHCRVVCENRDKYPAPQLCGTPAGKRRGSSLHSADARPQRYFLYAGLYAAGQAEPQGCLQQIPSQGINQTIRVIPCGFGIKCFFIWQPQLSRLALKRRCFEERGE